MDFLLCCPVLSPQITGYVVPPVLVVTVNVSVQATLPLASVVTAGPWLVNVSKSNLSQQISRKQCKKITSYNALTIIVGLSIIRALSKQFLLIKAHRWTYYLNICWLYMLVMWYLHMHLDSWDSECRCHCN